MMLVGVILCGGLAFFGVRWGMQQVDALAAEFEEKGYKRQMGQIVQVDQSPGEKTVYVCQVLTITKDVDVDIAIVSQVAEIKADIHGDVDFVGQVLKLDRGCVIDGDLRVKNAQSVEVLGEVKGKISGNYMVLNYQGETFRGGQSTVPPTDASQPSTPPSAPHAPTEPIPAEQPPAVEAR
jgi:hypothetical protein